VGQIPTLMQEEASFLYETTPAFFNDSFFLRHVDAFGKQMEGLKDPAAQKQVRNDKIAQASKLKLRQAMRNLKILSDAGVLIALGTDSGGQRHSGYWPGYFEHREMELMVQSGLTPMQVIVAATSAPARVMGLEEQLGTLEPGKWADLVILNANPLTDIRNLRDINAIWIAGRRLTRPARTN
jgi:imidazolonepropionase-like amidohydrolase